MQVLLLRLHAHNSITAQRFSANLIQDRVRMHRPPLAEGGRSTATGQFDPNVATGCNIVKVRGY